MLATTHIYIHTYMTMGNAP